MADDKLTVEDVMRALSGETADMPEPSVVPTPAAPTNDFDAIMQALSASADSDEVAPVEPDLPDAGVSIPSEEVEDALSEAEVIEPRLTPGVDVAALPPRIDDGPTETVDDLESTERPSRLEEAREESLLSYFNTLEGEDRDNFKTQLVQGLRAPDPATGRTTFTGTGLSYIAGSSDTGMQTVLGIVDAFSMGTSGAVDGIQATLEAAGEDSVTYRAINYAVNQFGRTRLADDPRELANQIADGLGAFFEFAETIPVLGMITTPAAAGFPSARAMTRASARQDRLLAEAYRNNVTIAEAATSDAAREAAERAAQVAANNPNVAEDLIRAFEARTGRTISTTTDDGRLVVDPELARQAGRDTLADVSGTQLATGADELVQPILRPEKFDAIVAIAADYQQRYPEAFTGDRTVIDSLFDLTVNKELVGGQELIDDLNKYGLSFEDYILTVVGSGSEAGKILNQLSQIRRARPAGVAAEETAKAALEAENGLRRIVMRLENVRRGGLVSQLATAARNVTSATIRAPLESLGNVMDTALYRLTNGGAIEGIMELFKGQNWRDSFADMSYIYSRPDVARAYSNFILNRPELTNQYDRMFNNINESQALTGRGSGTVFDRVVSPLEDTVDFLNIPNRWQEHLVRRGVFFGELQRLTRNEYGVDLIDALQKGQLNDLLNDASTVRPEGARSFTGLVDSAVNRALDVTYAKQPEIPVFRSVSQFIVRNGLTTVIPFPRFMFNSMELMGQYAAGASIPLTRKVASLVTGGRVGAGPLTEKDRQRITRNFLGIAAIGAAYQYRSSEDAPADYKQMNTSEGVVMDTSPQFPMRQYLYLGEATKRYMDGTFDDWFNAREFAETFAGSNLRVGTGNAILEEIASLADGTDLTRGEAVGTMVGGALGQYLSSWLVPFAQLIEAQRATGERGLEYKDVREDPTLDGMTTFFNELSRPMAQRGISLTAEEEAALPAREYVFSEQRRRVAPMSRVLLGLNQSSRTAEYGEYFMNKGFNEWDLSSTSDVPTVERWENTQIREVLPIIAEVAQYEENRFRSEYADMSDTYKDNFTEEEHVNNNVIPLISSMVRDLRTDLREIPVGAEDPYTNSIVQYRRIPPEFRKLATNYFVDQFDRTPDPTSAEDLQALTMLGVSLRRAYNQ
jgi:hypothetical protein